MNTKKIVIIGSDEEAETFQNFFGLAKGSVVAVNTIKFSDPTANLSPKVLEEIRMGLRPKPEHLETLHTSIPLCAIKDNLKSIIAEYGVSHIWISPNITLRSTIEEIGIIAEWENIVCESGFSFNPLDNRCKHVKKVLNKYFSHAA